jgi:hypothetical protein
MGGLSLQSDWNGAGKLDVVDVPAHVIVMTWLGTTIAVQRQSVARAK